MSDRQRAAILRRIGQARFILSEAQRTNRGTGAAYRQLQDLLGELEAFDANASAVREWPSFETIPEVAT